MTPLDVLRTLTTVSFSDHESSPVILPDCGRKQLRRWWRLLGAKTGAEIGVWEGEFARTICAETHAFLYAVDPWEIQEGYIEAKNDAARMAEAYRKASEALRPFPHQMMKSTSVEAARQMADRSLDFAYIDGNHLREHVIADLKAWAPKVKTGGVLAGHDYRLKSPKPFIQVVEAVNAYTEDHQISPWFVFAADKSPSWAWVVA